jgi:hypothetical protein
MPGLVSQPVVMECWKVKKKKEEEEEESNSQL